MKLLSVDNSLYLCLFHMVHWLFILGQGWLLSNQFCKACQSCLRSSFECVQFDELSDIYGRVPQNFDKPQKKYLKNKCMQAIL